MSLWCGVNIEGVRLATSSREDCASVWSLAGPSFLRLQVSLCDPGLLSDKPRGEERSRHYDTRIWENEGRVGSETLRDTGASPSECTRSSHQQELRLCSKTTGRLRPDCLKGRKIRVNASSATSLWLYHFCMVFLGNSSL